MTVRSRLRALGGDGRPRVDCPSCSGSGRVYDPDGPRQMWVVECRVARIRAQRTAEHSGEPYAEPDLPPEPAERPRLCWSCKGAGEVGGAALARHEADSREGAWLLERMLAGLRRQRELKQAAAADAQQRWPA